MQLFSIEMHDYDPGIISNSNEVSNYTTHNLKNVTDEKLFPNSSTLGGLEYTNPSCGTRTTLASTSRSFINILELLENTQICSEMDKIRRCHCTI